MKNNAPQTIRIKISITLLVCLFSFYPITNSIIQSQVVQGAFPAAQVTFVPKITPMPVQIFAATRIPTSINIYPGFNQFEDPILNPFQGFDYGYEIHYENDIMRYHLWIDDQELWIKAGEETTSLLIYEFLHQQEQLRTSSGALDKALEEKERAISATTWGILGFASSWTLAVTSCVGVPFTFWAAGGTGWACVAGIGGAIASTGGTIPELRTISSLNGEIENNLQREQQAFNSLITVFEIIEDISKKQDEKDSES